MSKSDPKITGGWILSGEKLDSAILRNWEGIALEIKIKDVRDESSFKRELIYNGVSQNVLSILYREYKNDWARPAFSQESMKNMAQAERLRRYCDLSSVLQMLKSKTVTLLDPRSWHDKNDTFYVGEYVKRKKLKTLLAFCMTKSNETYHHWRIYSPGTGGACVVFRRQALLARLDEYVDVTMGDVI